MVESFILFTVGLLALMATVMLLSAAVNSGDSAVVSDATRGEVFISAEDPRIIYLGRFDSSQRGRRTYSWSGTQIGLVFKASWVAAKLSAACTGDRYAVLIDGAHSHILVTSGPWRLYSLATGLTEGEAHTVQLRKISEPGLGVRPSWEYQKSNDTANVGGWRQAGVKQDWLMGAAQFSGFLLPKGGQPQPLPAPPSRLLEVVGDSDTAGFCANGNAPSPLEDFGRGITENQYVTWAQQIALALRAELRVQAVSGIGVVARPWAAWFNSYEARNCSVEDAHLASFEAGSAAIETGFNTGQSIAGMRQYIDRINPFDYTSPPYEYTGPAPEAVLLLIGPNDFNNTQRPRFVSAAVFKQSYRALLESRATVYKNAAVKPKLISVCGGSINGLQPCPFIQDAVDEFNQGRRDGFKAYYTTVDHAVWGHINNDTAYNGCARQYDELLH